MGGGTLPRRAPVLITPPPGAATLAGAPSHAAVRHPSPSFVLHLLPSSPASASLAAVPSKSAAPPRMPASPLARARPRAPLQPAAVAVPAPHAFTATPPCLVPLVSGVRGPDPGRPYDIITTELDAAVRRTVRRRGADVFAWKTVLPVTLSKTSAALSRSALDGLLLQRLSTILVTVYSTARLMPGYFVA